MQSRTMSWRQAPAAALLLFSGCGELPSTVPLPEGATAIPAARIDRRSPTIDDKAYAGTAADSMLTRRAAALEARGDRRLANFLRSVQRRLQSTLDSIARAQVVLDPLAPSVPSGEESPSIVISPETHPTSKILHHEVFPIIHGDSAQVIAMAQFQGTHAHFDLRYDVKSQTGKYARPENGVSAEIEGSSTKICTFTGDPIACMLVSTEWLGTEMMRILRCGTTVTGRGQYYSYYLFGVSIPVVKGVSITTGLWGQSLVASDVPASENNGQCKPPVAHIALRGTGEAVDGGTLTETVAPGGSITILVDGSSSAPGSLPIQRWELFANGTRLGNGEGAIPAIAHSVGEGTTSFSVRAIDEAGFESLASAQAKVTTTQTQPPGPPLQDPGTSPGPGEGGDPGGTSPDPLWPDPGTGSPPSGGGGWSPPPYTPPDFACSTTTYIRRSTGEILGTVTECYAI